VFLTLSCRCEAGGHSASSTGPKSIVAARKRAIRGAGLRPAGAGGGQGRQIVRDLRPGDWPEVSRIYAEGIATGNATFETEVPSREAWAAAHLAEHRFVAERGGRVVGWITLAPVSRLCCYAGVAEVSAYVAEEARGEGVGVALLAALVESSERGGIWTLQTGVFPENEPSLRLLRRFGFRVVGTQERLGRLHGVWRDVVLLERRSEVVG
jgi:L-amino acid N-acyltransferase YncA